MNTFGRIYRISIFGESHGPLVGVTIDGIPPGIKLSPSDFTSDLLRRKSGRKGTTPRTEDDIPEIVAGWFNEHTTGAPLTIIFRNNNTKSKDYNKLRDIPRPGHSDFVAHSKFDGYNDYRGGGHFSGRLTLALVAAGVVAKKVIPQISIAAKLIEAGGKTDIDLAIEEAQKQNDSIGGIVECVATGIPIGLGEPFFDSAESVISHLAFAIPAIKGIEFGSGFAASRMKGSEHNDSIIESSGKTATNNAGGITGGITNGNPLVFRIAVKPTSSISKPQQTLNIKTGKVDTLTVEGRHDTCIALRVPVVAEAITAIALADLLLVEKARKNR
ncbi:chorismate synthase [Tenuifilum thalassicum]|uniref:Chorismate synthase n=1 Tax=Tenuifilum thalassicum TaxID=2590900 RepID=A0A7D4AY26_9BACT|nr:chorismate synthase [Tenuifilum thalassicum]QKG80614.1 chorismate synthase [Tenuifilum thalassicum]